MKLLYFAAGLMLFILLLGFAMKNNVPVEVQYYLGYRWRAPMSLLLLIVFSSGVFLGVIACLGSLIRQRRRTMQLEKEVKALSSLQSAQG
jgi:putative membrane protein